MNTLELIQSAIRSRTPISFEYDAPTKRGGTRVGNPHATYFKRRLGRGEEAYLDLWQESGVSDSGDLPNWRKFILKHIHDVKLLDSKGTFDIASGYRPTSYSFPDEII